MAKIHWRRPYLGTVSLQGLPQSRGAQLRCYEVLRHHDAQVTVGEIVKRRAVTGQIVGGAPYGQYQAQHLLEIQRPQFQGRAVVGEYRVHLVKIAAVPDQQPVRQAIDLTEAPARGQRQGVEVGKRQLATRIDRIGAPLIDPQHGRYHLL